MGVSVGDLFVHRFGELVGDSDTLGVEEAMRGRTCRTGSGTLAQSFQDGRV